jgi:hypothetical protein
MIVISHNLKLLTDEDGDVLRFYTVAGAINYLEKNHYSDSEIVQMRFLEERQ